MTEEEFGPYLGNAVAALQAKQEYLRAEFGLSTFQRFWVDYEGRS